MKVLAISGSLCDESFNTKLLRAQRPSWRRPASTSSCGTA